MNQLDLPYSRLQGHPPHHPTCCICHLPNVVWIKHTSKRKGSYSSFMMGKEFSEFQVEPVSGGTPESGQVIWQRVWKLQLERKCFYPTRHVQLGLGLIWGCFIYGHMVQVFACHKGSGLQEVRVSTMILTSAYASEVWCIFWGKIIKYWILLENYSFLFSPLFHVSASVHFSFQNKHPHPMGRKELDSLNNNNTTHIHLSQSKMRRNFGN